MPMRNKTSWEDDDTVAVASNKNRMKKIQRVVMFLGSFGFLCIMASLLHRSKYQIWSLRWKRKITDWKANRKVSEEGNRNKWELQGHLHRSLPRVDHLPNISIQGWTHCLPWCGHCEGHTGNELVEKNGGLALIAFVYFSSKLSGSPITQMWLQKISIETLSTVLRMLCWLSYLTSSSQSMGTKILRWTCVKCELVGNQYSVQGYFQVSTYAAIRYPLATYSVMVRAFSRLLPTTIMGTASHWTHPSVSKRLESWRLLSPPLTRLTSLFTMGASFWALTLGISIVT